LEDATVKLKVRNSPLTETPVELWLREEADGDISLRTGRQGEIQQEVLLYFESRTGKIKVVFGRDKKLGFELDKDGYIVVEKYEMRDLEAARDLVFSRMSER